MSKETRNKIIWISVIVVAALFGVIGLFRAFNPEDGKLPKGTEAQSVNPIVTEKR